MKYDNAKEIVILQETKEYLKNKWSKVIGNPDLQIKIEDAVNTIILLQKELEKEIK